MWEHSGEFRARHFFHDRMSRSVCFNTNCSNLFLVSSGGAGEEIRFLLGERELLVLELKQFLFESQELLNKDRFVEVAPKFDTFRFQ